MNKPKYVTAEHVATRLSVSVRQVYRYVQEGKLRAIDISISNQGNKHGIRICVDSLADFETKRTINHLDYTA